jgi:imidazolonepropionase-like amidohydrolase
VDTIEHGLALHRAPELLDAMAKRGTVLVPTLSTFHDVADRFADVFAPPLVEQARRQREEAYLTLNAARDAGVVLAMGFDSGPPGADALEMVRMVEGGLSPHEGITAATAGSARALGLHDVGYIEPGQAADLLVLGCNPLNDVKAVTRQEDIWMVMAGGRIALGPQTAAVSKGVSVATGV